MGHLLITTIVLILEITLIVEGQLNGIKKELVPCYNSSAIPGIIIANNRPPTSLNIFLEVLRRLEDANPTLNVRDFSAIILQRFRQNGIVISSETFSDLSLGIPFSPDGLEAIKGTLILDEYLPKPQQTFFNGNLELADLCYFHYMISNVVNTTLRDDESSTCVRSAQYQARMRRNLEPTKNSGHVDVNNDEGRDTEKVEKNARRLLKNSPKDLSQCPLEVGVVYTSHGTVKMGQVLSGLSAAYNQEIVFDADNRFAATLSGDLAHLALAQVTSFEVGGPGGWNSTINPKYFFLQKSENLELTDQDIRGSIDGLLLSLHLDAIKNKYVDIKLSQIIDMYYSPEQRGVFDSIFRACNRNNLYSKFVSVETLLRETNAIIKQMDRIGNYPVTLSIISDDYSKFVDGAITNFTSYFRHINDLACPQQDSTIERINTDLLIFLDPNWKYTTVQPILSYILDKIEISKYGSRYTLFSGADGRNLTNSTSQLLEFHKSYNMSVHESLTKEFDYSKIYEILESIIHAKLNNNSYTGGESTTVLLITKSSPNENQREFLNQRKEIMKQFMPDVTVLVVGSGASGDYSSILSNINRDFISLSESFNANDNELKSYAQNVINKIKTVPRSIVNPNCGSNFEGSSSSFTITQYADLHSTNFYKIAPNYFFKGEGNKNLKITEISTGSINFCISGDQSSLQNGKCKMLQSSVETIDLTNWCGDNIEECNPIYMSIYANTSQYKCRDYFCRFPDSVKFTISLENVGCTSSALTVASNFAVLFMLFVFLRL